MNQSTVSHVSKRSELFRSTLRDSPSGEREEAQQQQSTTIPAAVPQIEPKDRHVDPAAISVSRIERSLRYTALVSSNAAVVQATRMMKEPAPFTLAAVLRDASLVVSHLDISTPRTPPNAMTGAVADGSATATATVPSSVVPSPPSKHSRQPQGKIPRMNLPGMPSVMPTLPPAAMNVRSNSNGCSSSCSGSSSSPTMSRPTVGPKLNDALQLVAEAARALPVKAVSLLEAALLVDKECLVAKAELGFCLLYGHGVHANVNKALRLFDACMACGHPGVLLTVGKCLRDGVGVPMDLETSIQWMYKAANMGYLPAMHEIGEVFEEGISLREVPPPSSSPPPPGGNYTSLTVIAAGGARTATPPVVQTFVLEKDLVQCYRWYRNAAEQGYCESQLNLAKLYMLGIAEGADAKVDHWLRQAAKNGSLEAAGLLQRRT